MLEIDVHNVYQEPGLELVHVLTELEKVQNSIPQGTDYHKHLVMSDFNTDPS